jgi:kynureninase
MPAMSRPLTREDVDSLDQEDELAYLRDAFVLPDDVVYLDGNSLGALPIRAVKRLGTLVEEEWGQGLVRSWNDSGWIDLPELVATALAPLLGASPDEVAVGDSTSVNLFKLLAGATRLRPGRPLILSEKGNFPTDLYVAQGVARTLGGLELRLVERSGIAAALDDRVAVLLLTHVDFRTGETQDIPGLTAAAHEAGALALWDLSHSAGALSLELDAWGVDLAVGSGYKYLNGGPGAPAFAFVARHLHDAIETPLQGWMGHAEPFAFEEEYRPAPGVARLLCGTPSILGLTALKCGIESVARAGIEPLRQKSIRLTDVFIQLVEQECAGHGLVLASPHDAARRGSHVSYLHPEGHAIVQALVGHRVIGDFRQPDFLRFGFAPAYVRFVDVWEAVAALRAVMESREWDRPEHRQPAVVT